MTQVNDSGNCTDELKQKIDEWLRWDRNEKTRDEIEVLVQQKNYLKLSKLLLKRLAFGTAGLRGVMGAGYNAMNDLVVIQSAQGLAKYVRKCFPNLEQLERGVTFGYDGRYNSKRFAQLSACVFLNEGIPVYLYGEMVATPFIPFAISHMNLLAGVMITASHNPKDDNGYKVYWNNGSQIISPHDKNIQKSILENLEPLDSSWNLNCLNSNCLKDPYGEMFDLYFEKLLENMPRELLNDYNAKSDIRFVYSAMHGVGYKFVQKALECVNLKPLIPVIEQRDADPDFPTVKFPNPEEGKSSLTLSFQLANETKTKVILANDPDADRLACAELNESENQWHVFTGNELGALLGWWALQCYKRTNPNGNLKDCYMLASTVSSKMLRTIARAEGFHFIETLTGFKWMGNKAYELINEGKTVLFAFEEAIGFMFSPTVLDKDGVSAACHLATMAAYLKSQNQTLYGKLEELYKQYGFHYTNNSYFLCYEPDVIVEIFERIRNFQQTYNTYPAYVDGGKYTISTVRDLTTGIDTCQLDGKSLLPASKRSQMITFTFANGAVITLRTSGTEPKIKYYAEMCSSPEEKDWNGLQARLLEMINVTVLELLQPEKNNLIPQSDKSLRGSEDCASNLWKKFIQ